MGYNAVLATDDTFTPVEMWQRVGLERVSITNKFFPDRVVVSKESGDGKSVNELLLPMTSAVYDSNHIVYLLRVLPLQTGFETTIPIFNSAAGSVTMQRIAVEGQETVVTPAGTFNAWKVVYGNTGSQTTFWISSDRHRYPVKITVSPTGENVYLLASISNSKKSGPVKFADQSISVTLPSGWILLNSGNASFDDTHISTEQWRRINFSDPELETSSNFTIIRYPVARDPQLWVSETVDTLIKMNTSPGGYTYYDVRPGSIENIQTASGHKGARFVVERSSDGGTNDIVSYTYVIAIEDIVVRAYLRTAREDFDRFKPAFDSIIDSIRLR